MWGLCRLIWWVLVDLFRPRAKLEAEILVLRQQINVLRRTAPKRLLLSSVDRLIFVGLYRLFPDVRGALTIVKPDTVSGDGIAQGGSLDLARGGSLDLPPRAGAQAWLFLDVWRASSLSGANIRVAAGIARLGKNDFANRFSAGARGD